MFNSKPKQRLRDFVRCRSGNFAVMFALMVPLLLGLAGGGIDYMVYERQRAQMQDVADLVALTAAKEAALKSWSPMAVQSIAEDYVASNLSDGSASSSALFKVVATPDEDKHEISVSIEMDQHHYFVLGYFRHDPQIAVSSVAKLTGETATCLLGLETNADNAVLAAGSSKILAKGCAIYSNSTGTSGLVANNDAGVQTAFTCTGGGYTGGTSNYNPMPTTDCKPLEDPLVGRPQPAVGACDFTKLELKNQTVTLNPGVYCDGLLIDNDADVTLSPGTYIINGGELQTRNNGKLTGKGVTIFFTGADGRLNMDGSTQVSLTAPDTGAMAGILLFQDRAMELTDYEISSKVASELLGTIYLPNGRFIVKAKNKVADQSAFTVIVARSVAISGSTQMYLNSDYASTTVPVPAGLGPSPTAHLLK